MQMSASPVQTRARLGIAFQPACAHRSCRACAGPLPPGARYCGDCGVAVEATSVYGRDGVIEHAWLEMLAALATPASAPPSDAEIMWQLMNCDDDTAVWSVRTPESDAVTRVDAETWPRFVLAHPELEAPPAEPATPEPLAWVSTATDATAVETTLPLSPPRAALLLRLASTGFPGEGAPVDAMLVPRGGTVDLGRSCEGPWCGDAYLDDWHARLTSDPEGVRVIDPGSQRGVWLRLDAPQWLRDGDQFRIGDQFLGFREHALATAAGADAAGVHAAVQLFAGEHACDVAMSISRPCVLGRGCTDILLHDPFVSAVHCRLWPDHDGVVLEDLGSSNGTWLRMRSGDLVPFGAVVAIGRDLYRVAAAEP